MTRTDLTFGFNAFDLWLSGSEEIRLLLNLDGDEVAEVDFPHLGSLIQIDGATNADEWKTWATNVGAVLIRENNY